MLYSTSTGSQTKYSTCLQQTILLQNFSVFISNLASHIINTLFSCSQLSSCIWAKWCKLLENDIQKKRDAILWLPVTLLRVCHAGKTDPDTRQFTHNLVFVPGFLGAVGAMWLALREVRGVGIRVVDRRRGGGGGRGGGGWCTGVFDTAATAVASWFVGWSHPVTAGRAVWAWVE